MPRWSTPTCGGPTTHALLLLLLPTIILTLLICAGTWTLPVFTLHASSTTYLIGAQGYATSGQDRLYAFAFPCLLLM